MSPHSAPHITGEYFIFGRNHCKIFDCQRGVVAIYIWCLFWGRKNVYFAFLCRRLFKWVGWGNCVRWIIFGPLDGSLRDKSFDIKGVNKRYWGGRSAPQFWPRKSKCKREKDFGKSWKEFCCTSKSNLSQIFNQGKGQSHYKTLQIVQKEKEWLCLKFWPFEASIYVKEIYSKLQKDFHKTNEQWCWKGKQNKLDLVGVKDCMYHQWK